MTNSIIIGSLLLLAGCACDPVYVTNPLTRPERPQVERITPEEVETVPYPVWTKIVKRLDTVKQYAEQLEIIIDSTHEVN